MTVDHGLQVHPANTLQGSDQESVDSHQSPCVRGFDVPFPELGAELLQELHLIGVQLKRLFLLSLFEPQKALMLGQKGVPAPDATDGALSDLDACRRRFCDMRIDPRVGNSRLYLRTDSPTSGVIRLGWGDFAPATRSRSPSDPKV